jgi:hypothetical protein
MNAGNTIQPCRRNGEEGKWEHIATCRNVHQAKRVRLHGFGSNTEEGDSMQPSREDATRKCRP